MFSSRSAVCTGLGSDIWNLHPDLAFTGRLPTESQFSERNELFCSLTVTVADARAEGGACEQVFTGGVKPRLLPTLTHSSRGQKSSIVSRH